MPLGGLGSFKIIRNQILVVLRDFREHHTGPLIVDAVSNFPLTVDIRKVFRQAEGYFELGRRRVGQGGKDQAASAADLCDVGSKGLSLTINNHFEVSEVAVRRRRPRSADVDRPNPGLVICGLRWLRDWVVGKAWEERADEAAAVRYERVHGEWVAGYRDRGASARRRGVKGRNADEWWNFDAVDLWDEIRGLVAPKDVLC